MLEFIKKWWLLNTLKLSVWIKQHARKLVIALLVVTLIFSGYNIAYKSYSYYYDNKQYEDLRSKISNRSLDFIEPALLQSSALEEKRVETTSDTVADLPYQVVHGSPDALGKDGTLKLYSAMKEINSELVGWIDFPGFRKEINYPIMQAKDNYKYLDKDFYKNISYAGSIFLDYRNNAREVEKNLLIYGHDMKDLSMFGNLENFCNEPKYYNKLKSINIDIMNMRLQYEIFSSYITKADFNYRQIQFADDKEYETFLETIKSKSTFDSNIELTPRDKIITLSTCNNSAGKDGRSVIHARLVKLTYFSQAKHSGAFVESAQEERKNIVTANSYLKFLSVEYSLNDKKAKAQLTPALSNFIKEYTLKVPVEADYITLITQPVDPKATFTVTAEGKELDPKKITIKPGLNKIKVRVVSQDGLYARTTTLHCIR